MDNTRRLFLKRISLITIGYTSSSLLLSKFTYGQTKENNNLVDASKFGIVYNKVAAAKDNTVRLRQSINSGNKIIVSGILYLDISVKNNIDNTGSIHIECSKNARIIFTQPGTLFYLRSNAEHITFKNCNFQALNEKENHFLFYQESKINRVGNLGDLTIVNNIFLGQIGGRVYGSKSDKIKFNIINISKNNHGSTYNFVWVLDDIEHKQVSVSDNIIKNLGVVYYYSSHTSHTNNKGPEYFERNRVVNDPDFYSPTNSGGYHCFILVKSNESHYRNNHVEGLKSIILNQAVFDIYQSSLISYYENNISLNNANINFVDPGLGDRVLYKGKGGKYKFVKNNIFKIEKKYLDYLYAKNLQLKSQYSEWYIDLISIDSTEYSPEVYFLQNVVDVPVLSSYTLSSMSTKILEIKNNSFLFDDMKSSFFAINHQQIDTQKQYTFSKNTITNRSSKRVSANIFVRGREDRLIKKDIINLEISDNNFNNYYPILILGEFKVNNLIFNNCNFSDNAPKNWLTDGNTLFYDTDVTDSCIVSKLKFTSNANIDVYLNRSWKGKIRRNENIEYTIEAGLIRSYSDLEGFIMTKENYNYIAEYQFIFQFSNSKNIQSEKFSIQYKQATKEIIYKDHIKNQKHTISIQSSSFKLGNNLKTHKIASYIVGKESINIFLSNRSGLPQLTIDCPVSLNLKGITIRTKTS